MHGGRRLAGRYRLDSPVGRGGMGEVWRAYDLRLNRTVAIKVLPSRGAPEQAVARFRREAEIAAGLQHPGIAVVFDIDTDDGLLFLVMELLDGTDLAAAAGRHPGGLPVERAAGLLAQIADALAEAHAKGVIHRDVKPSNVMLLDGDRIKVLDFGIARYAEQTTDLTGSAMIGTPAFMAPEQFDRGTPVDHRTDLYALGGVAYQLLTGRHPFTADTMPELIHDIMLTPAPAVRSLRPDVPEALDGLVAELLAKDPGDRPEDARAVAERLRTVTAPPEEGSTRTREATSPPGAGRGGPHAPPGGRRLFRGVPGLVTAGLALACIALLLYVLAMLAALVNPGGAVVDAGDFSEAPSCSALRPADLVTAGRDIDRYGDSRSACMWESRDEDADTTVSVNLHSNGTEEWTPAPEVAAKSLASQRDLGGTKHVTGPARPEPSLGQDAFSFRESAEYRHAYTVMFRKSNLVVKVRYSQYKPRLSAAELREAALRLATRIATGLKP